MPTGSSGKAGAIGPPQLTPCDHRGPLVGSAVSSVCESAQAAPSRARRANMRKPDRPKSGVIFHCAIYTRKSSDDGLEQEFNSLDAQREPARPISRASVMPDGSRSPKCTTMEASRVARWSARPCSGSSPISRLARFRSLSFTRSTAYPVARRFRQDRRCAGCP